MPLTRSVFPQYPQRAKPPRRRAASGLRLFLIDSVLFRVSCAWAAAASSRETSGGIASAKSTCSSAEGCSPVLYSDGAVQGRGHPKGHRQSGRARELGRVARGADRRGAISASEVGGVISHRSNSTPGTFGMWHAVCIWARTCRTGLGFQVRTTVVSSDDPQELPRICPAAGQCGTGLGETARPGRG